MRRLGTGAAEAPVWGREREPRESPNGRAEGGHAPTCAPVGGPREGAALLRRLAGLHAEAAAVLEELAAIQLDVPPRSRLMDGEPGPERPDMLMNAKTVAARLQIDPKTVRRWRREGKLPPAITIGGVVRWRAEDVERWLEGQVQ